MARPVDELMKQGQLAQREGRLAEAESFYSRARETALASGEQALGATIAQCLCTIASLQGDLGRELTLYVTSLSELRELGMAKGTSATPDVDAASSGNGYRARPLLESASDITGNE